jgi:O-antigen ligase
MAIAMALCLLAGVIWFGAVELNFAAPLFVAAVLLGILWAGKLFAAQVVSWKASPLHWPVLAFAVYTTIRYFTSPIEYESRVELFRVWLLTMIYFVCAFNLYRTRDRTILFAVLLVLAFSESLYGIWQFASRTDNVLDVIRPSGYRGRASGTYICPNHLAGFLEMVIALAVGRTTIQRFSRSKVQKSALQKIIVVYLSLFLLTGLIMTMSRAGWIALIAGLGTLWFWGDWEWRLLWPRLLAGAAAVCLIGLLAWNIKPVRIYVQDTLAGEQKKDGSALRDPSMGGRTLVWAATAKIARDYPIIGTGPGTFAWFYPKYRTEEAPPLPEMAHNDILQLAAEYGLIGFAIVIWALGAFFYHAGVIARRNTSSEQRAFAVGSALAVTTIIVHSWFDFNMHVLANAMVLVTLMGFTVAMDDSDDRYARAELNRPLRYLLAVAILVLCGGAVLSVRPAIMAVHYHRQALGYGAVLYWDKALGLYQKAVAYDRGFPNPYNGLGKIYFSQSKWRIGDDKAAERKELAERAAAMFTKSLELNPYQGGAWVRLASAYELAGQTANAAKCFDRAVALEPLSPFVYEHMGLFYRHVGEEEKALAAFETSRKLAWNWTAELNVQELKGQP